MRSELRELLRRPAPAVVLPTIEELRQAARKALGNLAFDSPEFGRLMETLAPSLYAFPFRIADEGKVVLRAVMQFDLSTLAQEAAELPAVVEHLSRTLIVDLFDPPSARRTGLRSGGCPMPI